MEISPMLIDSLKIQSFRGISEHLELDLSAPLTVLYAPNGTGKTSICDAVEWLLCGNVGRLHQGISIKSKLSNDQVETMVEASIPTTKTPFSIKRELSNSGSSLHWKDGSNSFALAKDHELLRRFVPGLPPSGNSNKAKVDWVRSTRFLETDSMNLLIDNDKDSNNTRKLIFSNLFGVSEYQKNELELNRIIKKLPSLRKINTEKAKINNKITEYETLIKDLIAVEIAPYQEHALNLLIEVSGRLDQEVNYNSTIEIQEYHKSLEIQYIRDQEALKFHISSLNYVQEHVGTYFGKLSHSNALNELIRVYVTARDALNKNLIEKKKDLEDKTDITQKIEIQITKISKTIENIVEDQETWLYERNFLEGFMFSDNDLNSNLPKIYKQVSLIEREISTQTEKLLFVEKQVEILPLLIENHEKIKNIVIELDILYSQNALYEAKIPLEEQVSKIQANLDILRISRENTMEEIEFLLASGKKYVERHTHDAQCPLCEHIHESHFVLQEKIIARFSKLSNKSVEEAELTLLYNKVQLLVVQKNHHASKINRLENQKNQTENTIKETNRDLVAAGMKETDLSQFLFVSKKLEKIQVSYQLHIKSLIEKLKLYKEAHDKTIILEGILDRAKSSYFCDQQTLPINNKKIISLDDLNTSLEMLKNTLKELETASKRSLNNMKSKSSVISIEIEKLEKDIEKKSAEILTSEEDHNTEHVYINHFKRKWSHISSIEDISDAEIERSVAKISKKNQTLLEVNSLFKKAEEYFIKTRDLKKKENESKQYRDEIKAEQENLKEWDYQANARTVIEKEIQLIKEEIHRFIALEISPLSEIINTLYLRAQGNKFIESIEARANKEGFLDWVAELNDKGDHFDNMNSLSQGQRQDLALAIFLARARNLGGTFFLDEPLAHLDDLNRVALLDILRIIVSEERIGPPLRLVITTASRNLLRHLKEKFSHVSDAAGNPALKVYEMSGNPQIGLTVDSSELVKSPIGFLT